MYALITGGSSGIGEAIAYELANRGYDIIIVARRLDRLVEVKKNISTKCLSYQVDLNKEEEINTLYSKISNLDIGILVNAAGFGAVGEFINIDIKREMEMVDTNIKALQILTKLFLPYFIEKKQGHILNVASVAGFLDGPYMATYYASKAYVLTLSRSLSYEIRKTGVKISVLCPGPVDTEFNDRANVKFALKGISKEKCAMIAVKKMLKGKLIIVPTFKINFLVSLSKLVPRSLTRRITAKGQKSKIE